MSAELIERFYTAFAAKDGAGMSACYAPDVRFSDPVFPNLQGDDAGKMWRMLTSAPGRLEIDLKEHAADERTGTARWVASYDFSQTGRSVVNDVRARFVFANGLIAEHRDDFDFHKWSRQALGTTGLLLGWTPILKGKVQKTAAGRLAEYRGAA